MSGMGSRIVVGMNLFGLENSFSSCMLLVVGCCYMCYGVVMGGDVVVGCWLVVGRRSVCTINNRERDDDDGWLVDFLVEGGVGGWWLLR